MNCATFKDVVAAYTDGDVTSAERCDIETHLNTCDACRMLCEDTRVVREAVVRHRVVEPMPDGLWERVRRALDRHTYTESRLRRFIFAAVGLTAIVALAGITVSNLPRLQAPIAIHPGNEPIPITSVAVVEQTSNTPKAFALVRSRLGADVPPVNLSLVGGRLESVTVAEAPPVGMLTYRLHGGLLRYYVSKKPFELANAERWTILNRDVFAVCSATGLTATWQNKGISYAVVTDYVAPEPKGLLAEFLRSLGPAQ